jgi:membrane-bound inhibitor of C-type lysozyme
MEWHMNKYTQMLTISLATMLVGGCSSIDKYNPFTENKPSQEISRTPANSTEYLCEGNKRFYVRLLDKGNGAWLIYPDREVNLDKVGGSGSRYSNGIAVLEINGEEANLSDGPKVDYKGCKAVKPPK